MDISEIADRMTSVRRNEIKPLLLSRPDLFIVTTSGYDGSTCSVALARRTAPSTDDAANPPPRTHNAKRGHNESSPYHSDNRASSPPSPPPSHASFFYSVIRILQERGSSMYISQLGKGSTSVRRPEGYKMKSLLLSRPDLFKVTTSGYAGRTCTVSLVEEDSAMPSNPSDDNDAPRKRNEKRRRSTADNAPHHNSFVAAPPPPTLAGWCDSGLRLLHQRSRPYSFRARTSSWSRRRTRRAA